MRCVPYKWFSDKEVAARIFRHRKFWVLALAGHSSAEFSIQREKLVRPQRFGVRLPWVNTIWHPRLAVILRRL